MATVEVARKSIPAGAQVLRVTRPVDLYAQLQQLNLQNTVQTQPQQILPPQARAQMYAKFQHPDDIVEALLPIKKPERKPKLLDPEEDLPPPKPRIDPKSGHPVPDRGLLKRMAPPLPKEEPPEPKPSNAAKKAPDSLNTQNARAAAARASRVGMMGLAPSGPTFSFGGTVGGNSASSSGGTGGGGGSGGGGGGGGGGK